MNLLEKYYRLKYEIKKKKNKNLKVLVPPMGSGDILLTLLLLKEYQKRNPEIEILIVVSEKYYKDLTGLFKDDIKFKCILDSQYCKYCEDEYKLQYKFHKVINNIPNCTMRKLTCVGLDLPINTPIFKPYININTSLKKNIVLLSPEAKSIPQCITREQWLDFAYKLKELNYEPVFNTKNKHFYDGFKTIFLNIKDTIEFCGKIKYFVGFCSGFCMIISAFCQDIKKYILYPNDINIPFYSIEDCVEAKNIKEINVDSYVFNKILQDIVNDSSDIIH